VRIVVPSDLDGPDPALATTRAVHSASDDASVGAGRDEMSTFLLGLRDPAALDARLTGGKAAALAKAAIAGLDTLPGVVLTTALSDAVDAGVHVSDHPAVREAFVRAGGDLRPLVARSWPDFTHAPNGMKNDLQAGKQELPRR